MSKKTKSATGKATDPEWVPKKGGKSFAVKIQKGVVKPEPAKKNKRKSVLTKEDYVRGVLANNRSLLAQTITLIESNSPSHYLLARKVLKELLPRTGNSLRIGITGVPGAGKSTLIEALGCFLLDLGYKVSVLAVDPSSTRTKGSILGDKTRMEKLSRQQNCFIRPSPSAGTLGGVARKSRETILVCEAAGYDIILVETMGIGQSEITVRSMVDFFLLVMIPGAGDELQGIKKGVMEIADCLFVNKAEGQNLALAERSKNEYELALKYLLPATKGWVTRAYTGSALTGMGIRELWETVIKFEDLTKKSGVFATRRKHQNQEWVVSLIKSHLEDSFFNNEVIKNELPKYMEQILADKILPVVAAENLLELFYKSQAKQI